MSKLQKEKKMPWKWYVLAVLSGLGLLMITTIAPIWHWMPVQITEEGKVVAITENGCVIDTPSVSMPVIQDCDAQPGDVIEVTYFVPSKVTSGYFEKTQQRADLVQPVAHRTFNPVVVGPNPTRPASNYAKLCQKIL